MDAVELVFVPAQQNCDSQSNFLIILCMICLLCFEQNKRIQSTKPSKEGMTVLFRAHSKSKELLIKLLNM